MMDGLAVQRRSATPRTYYVHGHRVQETRHAAGASSWSCDCAEYQRSQLHSEDGCCAHSQRVEAAASLERLLGAKGLILRAQGC